jgi:hypothetical protein
MNAIRVANNVSKYTPAVLSGYTLKQLHALSRYNPPAVPGDAVIQALVASMEGFTPADRIAVIQYRDLLVKGDIFEAGRFEEHAIRNGESVFYTKETVRVPTSGGEKKTVVNAMVPQPPSFVARPHLHSLSAFMGQFVQLKEGEVVTPLESAKFSKAWNFRRTPLDVSKIHLSAIAIGEIMAEDAGYKALSSTQRQSLTETRWVAFLERILNMCSFKQYFSCHMLIVTQLLRTFKVSGERFTVKKLPVVPDLAFVEVDEVSLPLAAKAAVNELKKENQWPVLYYYKGPLPGLHTFMEKDGELMSAKKAMTDGGTLRGSDKLFPCLLYEMKGYSGVSSDLIKRNVRVVSMAMSCILMHEKVDISLPSTGDIVLVVASLERFVKNYVAKKVDWKIYIGSQNQRMNVPPKYKGYLTALPRADAHYVSAQPIGFPAYDRDADYQTASSAFYPEHACAGFTIYTSIFGRFPFGEKNEKSFQIQGQVKKMFVYQFGSGSAFRGIVSTTENLALGGIEERLSEPVKKTTITAPTSTSSISSSTTSTTAHSTKQSVQVPVKSVLANLQPADVQGTQYVPVPLELIPTAEEWYNYVIKENVRKNAFFLSPVRHYSPISNVLYPARDGVILTVVGDNFEVGSIGDNEDFEDVPDTDEDSSSDNDIHQHEDPENDADEGDQSSEPDVNPDEGGFGDPPQPESTDSPVVGEKEKVRNLDLNNRVRKAKKQPGDGPMEDSPLSDPSE